MISVLKRSQVVSFIWDSPVLDECTNVSYHFVISLINNSFLFLKNIGLSYFSLNTGSIVQARNIWAHAV